MRMLPNQQTFGQIFRQDKTDLVESFLDSVIHENEMMIYKNQGNKAMVRVQSVDFRKGMRKE